MKRTESRSNYALKKLKTTSLPNQIFHDPTTTCYDNSKIRNLFSLTERSLVSHQALVYTFFFDTSKCQGMAVHHLAHKEVDEDIF
mmetsp:Transcript_15709/g.35367  ORF Transcript_15709/g.35367 Transcript_15709/m.35367 type:complete len:85 (+) Transcript_15709:289-543(+)